MSFYVTLPSDSSLNYFPENKISHFVTRLPSSLDLKGEWEVGLTELIYPHMWNNITEFTNGYEYVLGENIEWTNGRPRNESEFEIGASEVKKARIPPGFYESPNDIIKILNYQKFYDKISFNFNKNSKKVRVTLRKNARINFDPGLAESLGFPPGNVGEPFAGSSMYFDSPFAADPHADFKLMYIYSDLVEPQIVGDTVAPLLRVIPVKGHDGEMIHEVFDRPHYIPVTRKNFQTIETVIRTHTGRLMSFERGKLIVKLHFRQKYLS